MAKIHLLFLFLAFAFVGCASATRQTDELYKNRPDVQSKSQIQEVRFINQEAGHCGPATLTMALWAAQKEVSLDEITKQVYTPNMKGSLQSDMISASRRQGMTAIPISGINALLLELEAGHTVIIFENLGLSWIPQWHYALVTGYDLDKKTFTLHSGPNANQQVDIGEVELAWKLTDYWGLVVLQPNQISASADELSHLQAAVALEQINNWTAASSAYEAILKKWPKSLAAYIGLGNINYQLKNYKAAVRHLKKAVSLHPDSKVAQHNLDVALKAKGP